MASLPVGLVLVGWTGPNTTLASASWKNNVGGGVFKPSDNRLSLISWKPAAQFPAVTQLTQGEIYLFKVTTAFSLADAVVTVLPVPANPGDFKIWVVGDSIMSEDYGTPSTPTQIQQNYTSDPNFKGLVNHAVSGDTIRQQIDRLTSNPFSYDSTVDTYVLLEVGVNTLAQAAVAGMNAATAVASAKAERLELSQKLRQMGPRIKIVESTMPLVGYNTNFTPYNATVEAKHVELIQKFNADIRLTYASYYSGASLADRHASRYFDQLSDAYNRTYYIDNVHLAAAGKAEDAAIWIGALEMARSGSGGIFQRNRDTSVSLDYQVPATTSTVYVEAEDESQWEHPNTLEGAYTISTDPLWSGGGKGAFTSTAGTTWLTVKTCQRVKVIAPTSAGLGSWRLRITRLSDSVIIYNQVKSQATEPYTTDATNLSTGFMDTANIALDSYRIELICESGKVTFDCLALTVPVGTDGGGGASGLPDGFQGIVAPFTMEDTDPRLVLTIGPAGSWLFYKTANAFNGSTRFSGPEGPGAQDEYFHPVITSANGGQFYGTGLEYWSIRYPNGAAFDIYIDGVRVTGGDLYAASEQAVSKVAQVTGLPLTVHSWEIRLINYSYERCNLFADRFVFLS